jgi:hypothetical protein
MEQGVCCSEALPFTLKKYFLKAKEELWKLKYITTMQKKKNLIFKKETKIMQDITM